jgi:hypothetical protein
MTGIIILLGIVLLVSMLHRIAGIDTTAEHPFSCGSDEVCYCSKSENCKKREEQV